MTRPATYLVTGAAGFLGRHFLAEIQRRGTAARAMVRAAPERPLPGNPEVAVADLADREALAAAVEGVSHVVHLAARVHQMQETADDPLAEFRRVNVEGTRRLLDAAAEAGARRFLFMSSVKAMGEEDEGIFDEETPCRPETPYGISKLEGEELALRRAAEHGMRAVVLRLPMVYGPANKGNMLRLLAAAAAHRRLPFGRLDNRRSMVYVENVSAAGLAALDDERSSGQVYLVSDARPYSTRELYQAICDAMGREARMLGVPPWLLELGGWAGGLAEAVLRRPMPINPGVVRRLAGDLQFRNDKIRRQLGIEPTVDLAEGIRRTVEWYREIHPPERPTG